MLYLRAMLWIVTVNLNGLLRERTMWPAALTLWLQIQPGRTRCVWATCWESKITSSLSVCCCVSYTHLYSNTFFGHFEVVVLLQWLVKSCWQFCVLNTTRHHAAVLSEPVSQYHLISCSGFSLQHHWHVWRIHSQPAVLSDDLWTKLSLLQSSHWTQDRNRLLFCRRVCAWLQNNNRTPALH